MNTVLKQFEKYKDHEIIARILAGEATLYEVLVRRYNPFLYKIGRSYNYNHQDTEDLMQDTFTDAYYGLPKFENRSKFTTWLTRIMLNNCYHKKMKLSFQNEIPSVVNTDITRPLFQQSVNMENIILNKELANILEKGLNAVPEEYRIVFTLRELNGLTVAETAEVLSISTGNVKVRLNRAKHLLRAEIEKMYNPDDIFGFSLIYCSSIVERVFSCITEYETLAC